MPNSNIQDTQPAKLVKPDRKKYNFSWLVWIILAIGAFLTLGLVGAYGGYRAGLQDQHNLEATGEVQSVQEQFNQGLQDFEAGELVLARQRFEWVLTQDPNYPGAAEKLAEVMSILFATTTPTPLPPTPTLTPTPDLRPVEDLLNEAKKQFANGDWSATIDTVTSLRKTDPAYQVTVVDGLLYLALRNRGVEKILSADLEGGSYDLALAERFGPLDAEATNFREVARLYMFGSSFWEAYPEQAVYYFGQVASAAPGLRDASGWTARERYRAALIQYGDLLARNGDWCTALEQYSLAFSIREDAQVFSTAAYAEEKCYPPTPTITSLPSDTLTPTASPTLVELPSATPTILPEPSITFTPEVTVPPSITETATAELLPTSTETPPETSTEIPTLEPSTPTETATPQPMLVSTLTPIVTESATP